MIDDAFFNKSLQATWIKIYLMQKLLLGNGKPSSISNLEHSRQPCFKKQHCLSMFPSSKLKMVKDG